MSAVLDKDLSHKIEDVKKMSKLKKLSLCEKSICKNPNCQG